MFFQLTHFAFDGQNIVTSESDSRSDGAGPLRGGQAVYSDEWIFANPNSLIFEHHWLLELEAFLWANGHRYRCFITSKCR